jgi:predicted transcriptional regulator
MKRTTIFIPESLERDLQLYARRERKPAASVVREAIAAYLAREPQAVPLPSFAGAFDSGHTDTAERHEELLFAALTPHATAPSGATSRTRRVRPRASRKR